ncbi:MAG TPA: hypothetical protein PKA05_21535 [Roseiflexaceae bacterium]|nr:hypothetical protein [Roseiflexaceae bacterium]
MTTRLINLRAIRAMGAADLAGIGRDPLLRWMACAPLATALAIRLLFGPLLERIGDLLAIDLMAAYPILAGYALLLLPPMLIGMVIGFLLLDMADDRTLLALRVTPLPLATFLGYRLLMPTLVSILVMLPAFAIAGISTLPAFAAMAAALLAAPLAALAALALASFAANKVQGLALTKLAGIFMLTPIVAHYSPEAWQPVFWLLPTYWPARLLRVLAEGQAWWGGVAAGIVIDMLLLVLLVRRFGNMRSFE